MLRWKTWLHRRQTYDNIAKMLSNVIKRKVEILILPCVNSLVRKWYNVVLCSKNATECEHSTSRWLIRYVAFVDTLCCCWSHTTSVTQCHAVSSYIVTHCTLLWASFFYDVLRFTLFCYDFAMLWNVLIHWCTLYLTRSVASS